MPSASRMRISDARPESAGVNPSRCGMPDVVAHSTLRAVSMRTASIAAPRADATSGSSRSVPSVRCSTIIPCRTLATYTVPVRAHIHAFGKHRAVREGRVHRAVRAIGSRGAPSSKRYLHGGLRRHVRHRRVAVHSSTSLELREHRNCLHETGHVASARSDQRHRARVCRLRRPGGDRLRDRAHRRVEVTTRTRRRRCAETFARQRGRIGCRHAQSFGRRGTGCHAGGRLLRRCNARRVQCKQAQSHHQRAASAHGRSGFRPTAFFAAIWRSRTWDSDAG